MKISAQEALNNTRENKGRKYPTKEDSRFMNNSLFPYISPKFKFSEPCKVFTIGSCFARAIEIALRNYNIDLPTCSFSVPKTEWPYAPNGLLGEFNPGTMRQRILSAIRKETLSEETIVPENDGFADLLLVGGAPVSYERAIQRRAEIGTIYNHLDSSEVIIITLGMVEAWYDNKLDVFLNRIPPIRTLNTDSSRYALRQLDVFESYSLLEEAIETIIGVNKNIEILLTVSPVPLMSTFTKHDVIIANSFSKAVLRVCASKLSQKYHQVDYFPSYEISSVR